MECFPPCKTCTGLCAAPVAQRPVRLSKPRKPPEKRGTTTLKCGHTVPLSEITLTVLGDGLGAQPFCERCGDFFPIKKTRKKKPPSLPDQPLF